MQIYLTISPMTITNLSLQESGGIYYGHHEMGEITLSRIRVSNHVELKTKYQHL